MSIKKSVVIVNEYTYKTNKGGTRGKTPGNYVKEYMAREDAVERLSPVTRRDKDTFKTKYEKREKAVENNLGREFFRSGESIYETMKRKVGLGGIAFSSDDVSLSGEKLNKYSRDIQKAFDDGKTVLKTVISFEEEYLKRNNIIDKDFKLERKGDYKGHVDQLRLRLAIMNGVNKMVRNFDDPLYVGCIQVDTKHVHCHLAIVDKGVGNITKDGTQKGKITKDMKDKFRRGLNEGLDDTKHVRYLSAKVQNDRRNVKSFSKKYAYSMVNKKGFSQVLLALLPGDKSLWRASCRAKKMERANRVIDALLTDLFARKDSGYSQAKMDVKRYADERMEKENLGENSYNKLIENGEKKIRDGAKNAIFTVLKNVDKENMIPIDNMDSSLAKTLTMPYSELLDTKVEDRDDVFDFSFRLRNYASRLDKHKSEKKKYKKLKEDFDRKKDNGLVSKEAEVLGRFYQNEYIYNDKLMVKYQHMLRFVPKKEEYEDEYLDFMNYRKKRENLENMSKDKDMKKMKPLNAEEYGYLTYSQRGGRYMVEDPSVILERVERMRLTEKEKEKRLREKLNDNSLDFVDNKVTQKFRYKFDNVKALDLHHMIYDFKDGLEVDNLNLGVFSKETDKRVRLLAESIEYLKDTNQYEEFEDKLPIGDIRAMKKVSYDLVNIGKVREEKVYKRDEKEPEVKKVERRFITKLDYDLESDLNAQINLALNNMEFDDF